MLQVVIQHLQTAPALDFASPFLIIEAFHWQAQFTTVPVTME